MKVTCTHSINKICSDTMLSYLKSKTTCSETLCKISKFHLISWCGNFEERHSFRIVSDESSETMRKLRLSSKFHARKLGAISVFYAVKVVFWTSYSIETYVMLIQSNVYFTPRFTSKCLTLSSCFSFAREINLGRNIFFHIAVQTSVISTASVHITIPKLLTIMKNKAVPF